MAGAAGPVLSPQGPLSPGVAWWVKAWLAWHRLAKRGKSRRVSQGYARHGTARRVAVRLARHVLSWQGSSSPAESGPGMAGGSRRGVASRGWSRQRPAFFLFTVNT
jgi:hypothetical protein